MGQHSDRHRNPQTAARTLSSVVRALARFRPCSSATAPHPTRLKGIKGALFVPVTRFGSSMIHAGKVHKRVRDPHAHRRPRGGQKEFASAVTFGGGLPNLATRPACRAALLSRAIGYLTPPGFAVVTFLRSSVMTKLADQSPALSLTEVE